MNSMRNLFLVALLVAVAANPEHKAEKDAQSISNAHTNAVSNAHTNADHPERGVGKSSSHAVVDHGDIVHQTPLKTPATSLSDKGKKVVWAGFIGVALPATYFAYLTSGVADGEKKFHIYTTFICAIATLAYLTMATGHGMYTRPFDQREFFYARYIDWALTTPLMLLDLAAFAGASSDTTYFLVGCDFIMIVCGLMGALMEGTEKWYFWTFGMMVFMPIIYYLNAFKKSKTCTDNQNISSNYNKIANLTMITWVCYPIVWILAEGQGKMSVDTEATCYTVLDVIAKSVFGYIIVKADRHKQAPSTTAVAASYPAAPAYPAPAPKVPAPKKAVADAGSML